MTTTTPGSGAPGYPPPAGQHQPRTAGPHPAAPQPWANGPEEPPAPSKRKRGKDKDGSGSERTVRVMVALLGLATALAGTYGAVVTAHAKDVEASNTKLKRQNDTLVDDKSDLSGQVTRLQGEIDDLKTQLATPVTTSTTDAGGATTTPSGSTSSPGTVLRQTGHTPVTFSSGYGIDLDSQAPNWGLARSSGDVDFYLSDSKIPTIGAGDNIAIVDHPPSKTECDDATIRQGDGLRRDQMRAGIQFCTTTSNGNTAYVHVADINTDARTITLDIVVWA